MYFGVCDNAVSLVNTSCIRGTSETKLTRKRRPIIERYQRRLTLGDCLNSGELARMPGPGEWPALVHCDLWLASLNEWREGIMMWIYPQHPHMHHVGCFVVVA